MMRVFLLLLLIVEAVLSWSSREAHAACSGSGVTWTCPSGTTPGDINTVIGNASDGATVTFAAGSYTWGGGTRITPSISKGITLICETTPLANGAATSGGCNVSSSSTGMGLPSGNSTKLYRLSGFNITLTGQFLWTCPGGGCSATLYTQIRFDHNTFHDSENGGTILLMGENTAADNYFYGVADHNTIDCSQSCLFAQLFNGSSDNAIAGALGSGDNFFFEDNISTSTSLTNNGTGFVDGWGGHGVVVRYNTFTNQRILMHGVTHAWGPRNFEVYHNTGVFNTGSSGSGVDDCTRFIHHQGSGTMMFFNNTCTPRSGAGHGGWPSVLHYRSTRDALSPRCNGTQGVDGNSTPSGTYLGYPCKRQPGRDVNAAYLPFYAWINKYGDDNSRADISCEEADSGVGNPTACGFHIVDNRDRFSAVSINAQSSSSSPFNGTTGMGFGTLANRPTTCTTSSDAAATGKGVGYFATDQGSLGTLYTCSATNTWTTYYTPYTYPHPLVGGAVSYGSSRPSGVVRGSGVLRLIHDEGR